MKNQIKWSALLLLAAFCVKSNPAQAHDDKYRVGIEIAGSVVLNAGTNHLNFDLIDQDKQTVMGDADVSITHEKKIHLLVFDESLIEFHHEHPQYTNGQWQVDVTLPRSGNYWVWVQGALAIDGTEFSTPTKITVQNGLPANATPPVLGENRKNSDGNSVVTFPKSVIHAKKHTMFNIKFSHQDGTAVAITPYLGANAHIVAVLQDGDTLVHVHPSSGTDPSIMMLHMEFPEVGDYRIWVQFIDGGVLKVVPLSLTVIQ